MIKLEKLKGSQKMVRHDDDVTGLAVPNWEAVARAIRAGKADEALAFLEFTRAECQTNNVGFVSFVEMLLTHLARFGEEEIPKAIRDRYQPRLAEFLSGIPTAFESVTKSTVSQRRHDANFTVTEEPDRYVVTYDPCGGGGRLRRTRSVGTTKKAYPWSWGKAGVPYYCCHCCIEFEIMAIEHRGYPVKVILVGEKPEDPCVHLFYKKPELIPAEYFKRVGMTKKLK